MSRSGIPVRLRDAVAKIGSRWASMLCLFFFKAALKALFERTYSLWVHRFAFQPVLMSFNYPGGVHDGDAMAGTILTRTGKRGKDEMGMHRKRTEYFALPGPMQIR